MPIKVSAKDMDNQDRSCQLSHLPNTCPNCGENGQPNFVAAALMTATSREDPLYTVFRCPVMHCRGLYIATYLYTGGHIPGSGALSYRFQQSGLVRCTERTTFPANIESISAQFCLTYNQALIAEENKLDQICGPGYRKALEFLIKDYLVLYRYKDEPERQNEVKGAFLGRVIENHVDQERIKQCAKRAAWLGNDEVHYTRKWQDKDIQDLKSLVMMTVNHIDLTIESDRYLAEMPA